MLQAYDFVVGIETASPPDASISQTLTDASGPSDITGLVYDKTLIRSFIFKYTISRSGATRAQSGLVVAVTDGTNWAMSEGPYAALPTIYAGVDLTITSAGQVQYTADAGSATKIVWEVLSTTKVV